jgi:hypothetical protein
MGRPMATAGQHADFAHRQARMRMLRDKIIDVVALGLCTLATMALLTACPSEKSSEETGPASRGTDTGDTGPKPSV